MTAPPGGGAPDFPSSPRPPPQPRKGLRGALTCGTCRASLRAACAGARPSWPHLWRRDRAERGRVWTEHRSSAGDGELSGEEGEE